MTPQDVLTLARKLEAQAQPHALVTVVRALPPTSAYVGAQAIVLPDGSLHGWIGGGCTKGVVIAAAHAAMTCGLPRLVRICNEQADVDPGIEQHPMACASNGTVELFIQPYVTRPALCVLGATPAADEARFLANRLGIRLSDTPAGTAIVLVATQGEGDEDALESALASDAPHVLMIASRRKAERLREAMLTRGRPPERVASLIAPVGPDIGASTPGEIALAAVAEVVRLRRQSAELKKAHGPAPPADTAPKAAHPPPGYVNPVCGAAISTGMVLHTMEHDGLVQYFCCDHCHAEFQRDPARYTAIARTRSSATVP